jgi:hypothetical protein
MKRLCRAMQLHMYVYGRWCSSASAQDGKGLRSRELECSHPRGRVEDYFRSLVMALQLSNTIALFANELGISVTFSKYPHSCHLSELR